MTISFPTDKTQPFLAENGVTYYWDSDRWRVKTFKKEDDSRLPYRLGTDKAARVGEAAVELVDAQDNFSNVKFFGSEGISCTSSIQGITVSGDDLQKQIDELGVTKGTVARYVVDNIDGKPVSRPGQLSTNNPFWANVVLLSFGTEDADNVLTKPMNDDDIIEFVDVISNKVGRYKITDASAAPTVVSVEYVSGNNDFAPGQEKQVYIYPQNTATVSKEYVDDQVGERVKKAGDKMEGPLDMGNSKWIRFLKADGSNQYSIGPNTNDYATNIYAYNDGAMRFRTTGADTNNSTTHIILSKETHSIGSTTYEKRTSISYVMMPTAKHHAANKEYVDEKCKDIVSPIRTWKYKSGGGNPGPGEFTVSGENYIRIHHTTHKGMDLTYSNSFEEDLNNGSTNFAKIAFTAWKHENGKAQGKFFIWVGWFHDTSGYFELKDLSSTDKTDLGLQGTKEYELHLAGFF